MPPAPRAWIHDRHATRILQTRQQRSPPPPAPQPPALPGAQMACRHRGASPGRCSYAAAAAAVRGGGGGADGRSMPALPLPAGDGAGQGLKPDGRQPQLRPQGAAAHARGRLPLLPRGGMQRLAGPLRPQPPQGLHPTPPAPRWSLQPLPFAGPAAHSTGAAGWTASGLCGYRGRHGRLLQDPANRCRARPCTRHHGGWGRGARELLGEGGERKQRFGQRRRRRPVPLGGGGKGGEGWPTLLRACGWADHVLPHRLRPPLTLASHPTSPPSVRALSQAQPDSRIEGGVDT